MLPKIIARGLMTAIVGGFLVAGFSMADTISIYNQDNPPSTGVDASTPSGFCVQFDDATLSVDPDVSLPATLYLQSLALRRASGGSPLTQGDSENALIKAYTSRNAEAASWVGDSTTTANIQAGNPETNVTFEFANLAFVPSTKYYFYFSNAAGDPNDPGFEDVWCKGRIRVSNEASDIYPSGNMIRDGLDVVRTYDAVFAATFATEIGEEPLPGDLNGDDFVGGDDLDIVRSFWGQSVSAGDLGAGDPSGDGFVGGDDLDIVRANWGQGEPPSPNAVPEPTSCLLLITGLVMLGIARRARR